MIAPDGYAHSDTAEGAIRVIDIGQLSYRKGRFDLIEIAKRLCPEIDGLEFVLVGGGEVEFFQKMVADCGLSDRITFPGMVDDEKFRLLRTSDIFALPSYSEGQPIALLEAMAVGLPIISSTVGSFPEVIREPNGRIVEPGGIDAITKYIRELAESKEVRERMGRYNATEAQDKYSIASTMTEIGEVYRTLVSG